jgi:hypothetical protein
MSAFNEKAFWQNDSGEIKSYNGYDAEVVFDIRRRSVFERLSIVDVNFNEMEAALHKVKPKVQEYCVHLLKKPWYDRETDTRLVLSNFDHTERNITYQQVLNRVKRGSYSIGEMFEIMDEFVKNDSPWYLKKDFYPSFDSIKKALRRS